VSVDSSNGEPSQMRLRKQRRYHADGLGHVPRQAHRSRMTFLDGRRALEGRRRARAQGSKQDEIRLGREGLSRTRGYLRCSSIPVILHLDRISNSPQVLLVFHEDETTQDRDVASHTCETVTVESFRLQYPCPATRRKISHAWLIGIDITGI
jgi:hypothetical protein